MEFGVSLSLFLLSLCSAVSHLTLKGLSSRLGGTLAGCFTMQVKHVPAALSQLPRSVQMQGRALVSGCSKGALRPLAYR